MESRKWTRKKNKKMNYKRGKIRDPENQSRKSKIQWREVLKENEKSGEAEIMNNHDNNGNTFQLENSLHNEWLKSHENWTSKWTLREKQWLVQRIGQQINIAWRWKKARYLQNSKWKLFSTYNSIQSNDPSKKMD